MPAWGMVDRHPAPVPHKKGVPSRGSHLTTLCPGPQQNGSHNLGPLCILYTIGEARLVVFVVSSSPDPSSCSGQCARTRSRKVPPRGGPPLGVRFKEGRSNEVRLAKVRRVEVRKYEVRPAEVRPAEVCLAKVRPAEVGPAEVRAAHVRPAKVRLAEKFVLSRFARPRSAPRRSAPQKFASLRSTRRWRFCARQSFQAATPCRSRATSSSLAISGLRRRCRLPLL
jgi:hypothetical protein